MCLYEQILVLIIYCASYTFGFQQTTNKNVSALNIFKETGFSSFSYERCHRLCMYTSACESIDWNRETMVCRLNREGSGSKKNTSSTISVAVGSNAVKTSGPCMKRPCGSGHVCVPVASGTDFRCLPTQEETTTTITTTAAAATTTTAKPGDACTDALYTNGSYRCDIGCGFDEVNQLCRMMKECLEYENTFERYQRKFIKKHNDHIYRYSTTVHVDCKAECIAKECLTYEVDGNNCYLQNVFWFDVEEEERVPQAARIDHYQRNCRIWRQL